MSPAKSIRPISPLRTWRLPPELALPAARGQTKTVLSASPSRKSLRLKMYRCSRQCLVKWCQRNVREAAQRAGCPRSPPHRRCPENSPAEAAIGESRALWVSRSRPPDVAPPLWVSGSPGSPLWVSRSPHPGVEKGNTGREDAERSVARVYRRIALSSVKVRVDEGCWKQGRSGSSLVLPRTRCLLRGRFISAGKGLPFAPTGRASFERRVGRPRGAVPRGSDRAGRPEIRWFRKEPGQRLEVCGGRGCPWNLGGVLDRGKALDKRPGFSSTTRGVHHGARTERDPLQAIEGVLPFSENQAKIGRHADLLGAIDFCPGALPLPARKCPFGFDSPGGTGCSER